MSARSLKMPFASLGVRSLQDWLIENLQAFYRRTGIGGYAFDYTFLWYDGTSRYAQWWGWRRVMETLRNQIPDIVIDGRHVDLRVVTLPSVLGESIVMRVLDKASVVVKLEKPSNFGSNGFVFACRI